jgi:hypothetical protein
VVKIRYADLPGGLHVRVAVSGKDTIIYLLPGLTTMQRRAALRRARSSARVGQGPGLPTAGVAGAVMADGIGTTLRNMARAMRAHPAIFVPPVVIVGFAAIAYVLLVSVTVRVQSPGVIGPGSGFGNPISQALVPPQERPAGQPTAAPPAGSRRTSPRPSDGGHHPTVTSPSPSPSPAPSSTGPAPSTSPTPAQPAPSPSSSPSPGPNAGGTVSGVPGSGGSTLCVDIGPLGVCLSK